MINRDHGEICLSQKRGDRIILLAKDEDEGYLPWSQKDTRTAESLLHGEKVPTQGDSPAYSAPRIISEASLCPSAACQSWWLSCERPEIQICRHTLPASKGWAQMPSGAKTSHMSSLDSEAVNLKQHNRKLDGGATRLSFQDLGGRGRRSSVEF